MITLRKKLINKFVIEGYLSKQQITLLFGFNDGDDLSSLIGMKIENVVYNRLLKIAKAFNRTIKPRKNKFKKKGYRYKIPEIRDEKVDPYSHPLLGKQEYGKFYSSTAWRQLRYLALKNAGGCQCCGAKASDGVQIHVDHIKPRSRYPELELSLDNIQVLCQDCNIGKGDWDNTDWRGLE